MCEREREFVTLIVDSTADPMSERRRSSGASDDGDLNHSFDFDGQLDHDDAAQRAFAEEVFAARSAGFLRGGRDDNDDTALDHQTREHDESADGSSSVGGFTSRSNASRLLEALEALSQDADVDGNGIPPSLRGAFVAQVCFCCCCGLHEC